MFLKNSTTQSQDYIHGDLSRLLTVERAQSAYFRYSATLATVHGVVYSSTEQELIISLLSLDIKFMDLQEGTCIFYPNKLLKHSRQNRKSDVFIYNACGQELRLCPIKIITEYLKRRNELVDDKNTTFLFITRSKPYKTPTEIQLQGG